MTSSRSLRRPATSFIVALSLGAAGLLPLALTAPADAVSEARSAGLSGAKADRTASRPPLPSQFFRRVSSFYLEQNLRPTDAPDQATSAEIIAFVLANKKLVYTDGLSNRLGFIGLSVPAEPKPAGSLDLPGEPTSVVAKGNAYALVAVNTSVDPDGDGPLNEYNNPSGQLLVVDIRNPPRVVRSFELAGQPDSVSLSPSERYAAIVIENERDEDENDGLLPQTPAGTLQVLDLQGPQDTWDLTTVDLTGLADVAPEDPEPEFVDVNYRDRAVVSMQENNHLVVVNLRTARVENDFSAGTVDLDGIDTTEEELGPDGAGLITLDGSLTDRRREPDSVQWIDNDTFATANEGDYEGADGVEGGTRSFTLFNTDGTVEYEAGNTFEHKIVAAGHYPEFRSENKGAEPEGLEVGTFRGRAFGKFYSDKFLFVGAERANAVAVYDVDRYRPRFVQLLPTGIGPEGISAAGGTLLAISAEVDGFADGFGARPMITFYKLRNRVFAPYPMLRSVKADGLPIPWVAQSGLSGDPVRRRILWSVSDSFLAQGNVYKIKLGPNGSPALIVKRLAVGEADGSLDLEGIYARPEGGFWLASEGKDGVRPNELLRTDQSGDILERVELPAELAAQATNNGLEGVTGVGTGDREVLYVAVQREWADDAAGVVKIGRYQVATGEWTFADYSLDAPESSAGGWVGLSEITALPDGRLAIIERDNQIGRQAAVKRLYTVDPASHTFAPYGQARPLLTKTLLRDVLGDLDRASVGVPDKPEGLGLTSAGKLWLVTDNDGVEENYGETVLIEVTP